LRQERPVTAQPQQSDRPDPIRVLVILAHPDDPEFFCGGTVARWVAEGRQVHYCLLTRGDKGADEPGVDPAGLADRRVAEQQAACRVLGVSQVIFFDYPDGYLVPDLEARRRVVRVIRQIRPQIVITCDPANYFPSDYYINHPDHRAAGQIALEAVFPAAGSALFFPELLGEDGLQPHKVGEVYIAGALQPNTTVDVSDYFEVKLRALQEHASQVARYDGLESRLRERMRSPDSPPDDPRLVERFRRIDLR
jgi:LmbE family N-acetylglucosaminyl deacetylase